MDPDEEIEWDINSIKRYEKLLMFESEYPVRQMELVGGRSRLCCLSDKDSSTSLLTVYNLPPRLSSSDSKASLSPHFDLKIIAGTFNKNRITQIGCVESCDWVIASEQGASELLIYKLNSTHSDKLVMSGVVSCDGLTNPAISVSSELVIACRHSSDPISLIDIKDRREKGKRKWPEGEDLWIRALHLSTDVFIVFSTEQQPSALLFDSRQPSHSALLNGDKVESGRWTAGSGFKQEINSDSQRIAFLSDTGKARFYDLRNLASPNSSVDLGSRINQQGYQKSLDSDLSSGHPNESKLCVNLNPLNESLAAISGLDSRVHILDTDPNCCVVFSHDGHEHMESNLGEDTVTTSHMFYHPGGPRSLISSSDNSSINCWTYNTP